MPDRNLKSPKALPSHILLLAGTVLMTNLELSYSMISSADGAQRRFTSKLCCRHNLACGLDKRQHAPCEPDAALVDLHNGRCGVGLHCNCSYGDCIGRISGISDLEDSPVVSWGGTMAATEENSREKADHPM